MFDVLKWILRVDGAKDAANDFNNVSNSLKNADQASRVAATRFTGLASVSSALGTSVSQVTPKLGGMASALGTAGGAVSGLVTAIGGVGGLVGGGLIAALALTVKWFNDSRQEAEKAKDEYIKVTLAAMEAAKSIDEIDKARAKASRRAFGTPEERDLKEDIEEINNKINKLEKDRFELINKRYKGTQKEKKAEFDRINAAIKSLKISKESNEQKLKELRNLNAMLDREEELATDWANTYEARKKQLEELGKKSAANALAEKKELDAWINKMAEIDDDEAFWDPKIVIDQKTLHEEAYYAAREQRMNKFLAKQEQAEKQAADRYRDAWMGSLDILGSATQDLMANMIMGQELNLESLLQMVGTQIVKDGLKNAWVAGGLLLNPLTVGNGAALMGYSAAEVAAGAAMGQIAGSGGDSGPSGFSGGSGAASPTPTIGTQPTSEPAPIVIHVHALESSAEVGRKVFASMKDAANKYGASSIPTIPRVTTWQ